MIESIGLQTYVLYHADCNDGMVAAWVVTQHIQHAVCIPVKYGESPPEINGAIIYIVDFCYAPEIIIELAKTNRSIVIIDHHKTAYEKMDKFGIGNMPENVKIIFDRTGKKSGAYMTAEYFIPRFFDLNLLQTDTIRYVSDYDTWQHQYPESILYFHALNTIDKNPSSFNTFIKSNSKEDILKMGSAIKVSIEKNIEWIINNAMRVIHFDTNKNEFIENDSLFEKEYADKFIVKIPFVNVPHYMVSLTLDTILKDLDVLFAVGYYDGALHRTFRLNSRNGFDVSVVAEKLIGGGHPASASFKVKRGHWLAKI